MIKTVFIMEINSKLPMFYDSWGPSFRCFCPVPCQSAIPGMLFWTLICAKVGAQVKLVEILQTYHLQSSKLYVD